MAPERRYPVGDRLFGIGQRLADGAPHGLQHVAYARWKTRDVLVDGLWRCGLGFHAGSKIGDNGKMIRRRDGVAMTHDVAVEHAISIRLRNEHVV